jgi:signal transduction histidine kinase
MKRLILPHKMLLWLVSYLLLLTVSVFGIFYYLHEQAEHAVWSALLESEMDSIIAHRQADPHWQWQNSDTLRLFTKDAVHALPEALQPLPVGLHDDVQIDGIPHVVLVQDAEGMGVLFLVLEITDFEAQEQFVGRLAIVASLAMALITIVMAWIGLQRFVRPILRLQEDIAALRPEQSARRLQTEVYGNLELAAIAQAVNGYLERNHQFVERERAFVNTVSHELRTPVAVIKGAADLVLEHTTLPDRMLRQLERMRGTAAEMEQLIQLLLVLAREPARLATLSEIVSLDMLLPSVVADHAYLAHGKALHIHVAALPACRVNAPAGVAEVVIGNILRNAIENSDGGTIRVSLTQTGRVTIDDCGHGISAEAVAAAYARTARAEHTSRIGVGLELIGRLCDHLGWGLQFEAKETQGTRVTLDFASSLDV